MESFKHRVIEDLNKKYFSLKLSSEKREAELLQTIEQSNLQFERHLQQLEAMNSQTKAVESSLHSALALMAKDIQNSKQQQISKYYTPLCEQIRGV